MDGEEIFQPANIDVEKFSVGLHLTVPLATQYLMAEQGFIRHP